MKLERSRLIDVKLRAVEAIQKFGLAERGWTLEVCDWGSERRLGQCDLRTLSIRLSLPYVESCGYSSDVENTVLHEIAHALVYEACGTFRPNGEGPHGKTWQAVATMVGAAPVARRVKKVHSAG